MSRDRETPTCALCGESERSPRHERNDTQHRFVAAPPLPPAADGGGGLQQDEGWTKKSDAARPNQQQEPKPEGESPMSHLPLCECGHVHATAEQDGVTSVFHRCRAKGCACYEYRYTESFAADTDMGRLINALVIAVTRQAQAPRDDAPTKLMTRKAGRALDAAIAELQRDADRWRHHAAYWRAESGPDRALYDFDPDAPDGSETDPTQPGWRP